MGNRSNKPPFTRRPEDWFSQVRSSEAITSDVDAVLATRFVNTTSPITGGGSLAADRTLVLNGTKAEFNAACSDGDFLFVGDVSAYTDEQARDALGAALVAGTNITITVNDAGDTITIAASGGATLADGDYGDITVSGGGITLTIDNDVVTFAKMQNISTDKLLGRDTAASGDVEEIGLGLGLEFSGSGTIRRATGTSFPGSPASGDLFWRSDRKIEYVYDGTRWLSTQLFTLPIAEQDALNPVAVTTGFKHRGVNPWAGLYDIYVEEGVFGYFLTAAGNWTLNIVDQNAVTLITTTVSTASTHTTVRVAENTVYANATYKNFNLSVTENSGTASIYVYAALIYRLIG